MLALSYYILEFLTRNKKNLSRTFPVYAHFFKSRFPFEEKFSIDTLYYTKGKFKNTFQWSLDYHVWCV